MEQNINQIEFERKLTERGNSVGINVPIELLRFLEAKVGDNLGVSAGKSNGRKYIKIWKSSE